MSSNQSTAVDVMDDWVVLGIMVLMIIISWAWAWFRTRQK